MVCLTALQTAAAITADGGEAIAVPGDVTASDFPERIMKSTMDKFGSLDILINNAGWAVITNST